MNYQTLLVTESTQSLTVTLHRPAQRNSFNALLLTEMHQVLDRAEDNSTCRFVILQGENNIFCTGMDFREIIKNNTTTNANVVYSSEYMALLKRFTSTSKIIISILDGQVLAGGVGVVAASDLVFSTARTQFSLSEALWGLLPACVIPFLIRRIGFQKAYHMTLTTQTVSASDALTMGLIDELADDVQISLKRVLLRLSRINEETVSNLKTYFRKMWIISEAMEKTAIVEINRLMTSPRVQNNIKNFVEHQQFPWETTMKENM